MIFNEMNRLLRKDGQIEILKNHTITTRVIQYINAIKEIV